MEAHPRRRHDPDRADGGEPALALRAHPAVRQPRVRADVRRRPALLAARRRPVLGPQHDHPRRAVHGALRPAAAPRQASRSAARSSATTSSRRRSWAAPAGRIWLAYDLGGSWEEVPSTLLEEMKRDRRWCQGNLQHLRLLFTEGLVRRAPRALPERRASPTCRRCCGSSSSACRPSKRSCSVLREPDYFPNGPEPLPRVAGLAARLGAVAAGGHRPASSSCRRCSRILLVLLHRREARRLRRRRPAHAVSVAARDHRVEPARADPHGVPHPLRAHRT